MSTPNNSTQTIATSNETVQQSLDFATTIPLTISADQIGMFVGAKGIFLKKFVFGPTARLLEGGESEGKKVLFSVKEEEVELPLVGDGVHSRQTRVVGHLSASSAEALETLKEQVIKHQEATHKKIARNAEQKVEQASGLSQFVFKATLPHDKIGDFIGRSGHAVAAFQDTINDLDTVEGNKTNVSISKNRFVNTNNCHFHIMDPLPFALMEESDAKEFGQPYEVPYVIITVKTYTKSRRDTWVQINELLTNKLTEITMPRSESRNGNSHSSNNYLDEGARPPSWQRGEVPFDGNARELSL